MEKIMVHGGELLGAQKTQEAIARFDEVIGFYEEQSKDLKEEIYCARSSEETLFYLLDAANRKQSAVVLSRLCVDAYYFKAYALVELGELDEAKKVLQKGIALSPQNARMHSELGHIFQVEKNWQAALESFRRAEQAAEFSPAGEKNDELARAWRGMGFALIETHQLDEAEKIYNKCLSLNPQDENAKRELQYIQSLRAK